MISTVLMYTLTSSQDQSMPNCRFQEGKDMCRDAFRDGLSVYCSYRAGITPGGQKTINTLHMVGCPKVRENLVQPKTIHDAICLDCGRVFQFREKFEHVKMCPLCRSTKFEEYYGVRNDS